MLRSTLRPATPAFCLCLTLALLAGCSALLAPRSEPPRYYLLSPAADPATNGAGSTGLHVGLGPVTLPGYLDRKQLVTRVAENRLELSERDQWAEPIGENVKSVLAQDLQAQLPGALVSIFPWNASFRPDVRVRIDFSRFEATSAGTAELAATWKLLAGDDVVAPREARLSRPIAGEGSEAAVAALGAVLADFAAEIATEIQQRPPRAAGQRR